MTSAAAKTYLELVITESCDEDLGVLLAIAQVNPTDKQVTHLHQK